MKQFFTITSMLVLLLFFFSCKKNNNPGSSNTSTDTLATGWKKVVLSEPVDLVDIFFINNTGFTIFLNGIFKSTDGGNNWSRIAPTVANLTNLGMGSELNAVFVSYPNKLISTHNGGINLDTSVVADNFLTDVFFVSSTIVYAAGKSFWKSVDGGYNWTKLYDFTVQDGYKSLYFLNEQVGWVIRAEGLYKTTDGGVNWQLISTPSFNFSNTGNVFFTNSDTGYISDNQFIGKTVNGGASWSIRYNAQAPTYHDIHFITDNIGYITDGSRIYKTIDGGNTWTKEVSLIAGSLIELHFTDLNHGWACGSQGTLLKFGQ
jgi:photosystem II stability/assembly factor-like uncharacterized protein